MKIKFFHVPLLTAGIDKSPFTSHDGVAKSPFYGVTTALQDFAIPDVCLHAKKPTRPCRGEFFLNPLWIFCENISPDIAQNTSRTVYARGGNSHALKSKNTNDVEEIRQAVESVVNAFK
jgi:hypothetical protein